MKKFFLISFIALGLTQKTNAHDNCHKFEKDELEIRYI